MQYFTKYLIIIQNNIYLIVHTEAVKTCERVCLLPIEHNNKSANQFIVTLTIYEHYNSIFMTAIQTHTNSH